METNIREGLPAGQKFNESGDGFKAFLGWLIGAVLSFYPLFCIIYGHEYRPKTVGEMAVPVFISIITAAAWPLAWLVIGLVVLGSVPL